MTTMSRWFVLIMLFAGIAATPAPVSEYSPPGETAMMQQIVDSFSAVVARGYKEHGKATRDAHAKAQGCVHATVTVHDNLPAAIRHGVFARPHTYLAWIRFSNGSGEVQADGVPDGRGMAIKLTGVDGPKLIPDEKFTQDFVMIDFPVFFAADVPKYALVAKAIEQGHPLSFFASHPESARIAAETTAAGKHDQLLNRYFSMTPYLLGETYLKFGTLPVSCKTGAALNAPTLTNSDRANFLRARMAASLASGPSCFALQLQPRSDAATMPIEDASTVWDETKAPFITVASITIPKQRFTSPSQQAFCDALSYNPWHGTTDFRPVGGLNRLRLFVYRAISKLRHTLNKQPTFEPTGKEVFS